MRKKLPYDIFSSMSKPTLRQLLEAGVHFGHKSKKWDPKMRPYIFAKRSGVHIVDLAITKECLGKAIHFLKKVVTKNEPIIFVGTKKQAAQIVKTEALRSGCFYVTKRWMGGLLTNFENVKRAIERLAEIKGVETSKDFEKLTKREQYKLRKEREKREELVGGLCGLENLPGALFIVDPKKEKVAVREAKALSVPLIALIDTNGDPTLIDYPIPGNDDALRSIQLITETIADAIIEVKESEVKVQKVKGEK